ncbi:hypothetical protein PHLCEN_2v6068 [Hermanssonia centrifuga]|uniref:Uncharacterized protein n=1 Tax=Hermanssonia centrifuga TaxID=98765 RepID=A0A2R6P0H6_9APHY|nr:hypothetical protein PHLCEN_2v6068 [Hermanssonia centrifuga]
MSRPRAPPIVQTASLMQQAPTSAQSVAAALKNPKTVEGKAIAFEYGLQSGQSLFQPR